jgi:hypothetical protein
MNTANTEFNNIRIFFTLQIQFQCGIKGNEILNGQGRIIQIL